MILRRIQFVSIIFVSFFQSHCALPLAEQFKQAGYVELCDKNHGTTTFDSLYACFDKLITVLQANPTWAQKLYRAKEHFIRSKDRHIYSTDFFGFYDESTRSQRSLISFYYSIHFHEFIRSHYPALLTVPEISRFFEMCKSIQASYAHIFVDASNQLGLENIFSSTENHPPILFKVIKYFPSYRATRAHYDGTAFSLFLDSTDNQSLLLSSYKPSYTVDDFCAVTRTVARQRDHNSIVLIPGTFLKEFSIYPTPHIVAHSGKIRYATIAFAMRPHYVPATTAFSPLPNFSH